MVKPSAEEVRDALNRVYAEESSELGDGLPQVQSASLPKEDWRCVGEVGKEFTGRQVRNERN